MTRRKAGGREPDALVAAGVAETDTTPALLLPLAERSEPLALAVVERLAREPDAERAKALQQIAGAAERHGWKAVAKEARRVLYRFGQRGIAVPTPTREPSPSGLRLSSSLEGYVSPIDGRGDRLVWLIRPQREGGLVVLTAIVNEPAGLREVAIADLGRKTLRRMQRDLESSHRLVMVSADGAYCDALLAEGYTRAREAGVTSVGEYPAFRARLVTAGAVPREPPLIARVVDLEATDLPAAAQRGAALLDEPEFRTWPLERAILAPYVAEITAVRESPLVLSAVQQEERVRRIIARAVEESFSAEHATAYARRLEEMAFYLHATGRRDAALAAAATARQLTASARGGEGIPFCEELVRRSFALLLSEDAARAEEAAAGSVLVRPGAEHRRKQRR